MTEDQISYLAEQDEEIRPREKSLWKKSSEIFAVILIFQVSENAINNDVRV